MRSPFWTSPMLESKLVCVLKTSLAEKSIASLVKLRRQLMEVSGCSWEIASVWAEEHVPAGEVHIRTNEAPENNCLANISTAMNTSYGFVWSEQKLGTRFLFGVLWNCMQLLMNASWICRQHHGHMDDTETCPPSLLCGSLSHPLHSMPAHFCCSALF